MTDRSKSVAHPKVTLSPRRPGNPDPSLRGVRGRVVEGNPAAYPRRILLAVTGLTPQIVTETLYALAVDGNQAWIPTEIRLVTTLRGAKEAERTPTGGRSRLGPPAVR